MHLSRLPFALGGALLLAATALAAGGIQDESYRFHSGVELVNVTATVSDGTGRFVSGLQKDDFEVFEDGQQVNVTYFNPERVPVSLGIVLDTSGSMTGLKIREAQLALERFVFELLDARDEFFLYRFSDRPVLLQGWTNDRELVRRSLDRIVPAGATALYDAVADAIPLAQMGQYRKKAILVISDGNDTSSHIRARELRRIIQDSDVLVYAIGIDGEGPSPAARQPAPQPVPPRMPIPFPGFPGMPRGRGRFPFAQFGPGGAQRGGQGGYRMRSLDDDRVNAAALRELTDDSGGRTEIIRDPRDLNPSTASIADELSKQYLLGYPSLGKRDGRWHPIRVVVRNPSYRVRARQGYTAN